MSNRMAFWAVTALVVYITAHLIDTGRLPTLDLLLWAVGGVTLAVVFDLYRQSRSGKR